LLLNPLCQVSAVRAPPAGRRGTRLPVRINPCTQLQTSQRRALRGCYPAVKVAAEHVTAGGSGADAEEAFESHGGSVGEGIKRSRAKGHSSLPQRQSGLPGAWRAVSTTGVPRVRPGMGCVRAEPRLEGLATEGSG